MRYSIFALVLTRFFSDVAWAQAWPLPDGVQAYESCDATNSYLEKSIADAAEQTSEAGACFSLEGLPEDFRQLNGIEQEFYVSPKCVYASMRLAPLLGNYQGCSLAAESTAEHAKFVARPQKHRPCLSRPYHYLVYVRYLETMRCLGINPRELFPIINEESKFQANAMSPTGAVGLGQLTGGVVNSPNMPKIAEQLLASRGDFCTSELRELLLHPIALSSAELCNWLTPKQGIARNFLYAGLIYLGFKNQAQELLYTRAFRNIPARDRSKVRQDLITYLYNAGEVVAKVVNDAPPFDSFEAFREAMPSLLSAEFPNSPARAYEVSTYLNEVVGRMRQVNRAVCPPGRHGRCAVECSDFR